MKDRKFSWKQIVAISLSTLILSSLIWGFVFSSPDLSYTTVLEEGSMVTESSYIIFKDGTTYYARDGDSGEIVDYGTNASDIINGFLNNYTTITIKTVQGSWDPILLTHPILIPNNTRYLTFVGESDYGQLQLADAANCDMFQIQDGCHWLTWRGLYIHGNVDEQTSLSHGIHFLLNGSSATSDIEIVDNAIVNFNGAPIYFEGTVSASYVRHNYIEDSVNASILIEALHGSTIESNVLWNCTSGIRVNSANRPRQDNIFDQNYINGMNAYGIFINTSHNNKISENRISNSERGIFANVMYYSKVIDNYLIDIEQDGIDMYSIQHSKVCDNEVYGAGQGTNDTYAAIQLGAIGSGECHSNLITGNLATTSSWTNKTAYGIFVAGDSNMILDGFFTGSDEPMSWTGSNNEVHDCYNGTSYIS